MARNLRWRMTFCVLLAAASLLLVGATEEELARRRQRIEQMTPAEKAELARKQDRFFRLPREKQEQLRQLHERLDAQSDGEALRDVMRRYCDWLDTLLPYARNELEKLPVAQRVESIKQRRYLGQDTRAVREWGKAHFERLGLTPRKLFSDWMVQIRSPEQRRMMHSPEKAESWRVKFFRLEEADLSTLRDQFSPATREWFDKLSPEQQRRRVAAMLVEAMRRDRPPEVVGEEQLAEFFTSKSLSDEQREQLLRMPGDEMHSALVRLYHREQGPGFPRGGPRRRRPGWEPPFDQFPRHRGPGDESSLPPPGMEDGRDPAFPEMHP